MTRFEPWPQSKADNVIEYGVSADEPRAPPGASDASVPRLKLRAGASRAVYIDDAAKSPGIARIQARYSNSRAVMAELIAEVMPAPSQKSAAEIVRGDFIDGFGEGFGKYEDLLAAKAGQRSGR